MGQIYYSGAGVKHDLDTSVKFTKTAANMGFYIAQFELAGLYSVGHGVDRDFGKTCALYSKSAIQGYSAAIDILPLLGQIGKIMELVRSSTNKGADQSDTKDPFISSSSCINQHQLNDKSQLDSKKVEFT